MRAVPVEERFWPKVDRAGDGECWLWRGAKCGHGYGAIRAHRQRHNVQAHRVSYEMAHGPIPEGLHVLHRCDTPACVNPAHLFLGTHQQNMDDMAAKGRRGALRGEAQGNAKLTDELVRQIRAANGYQDDIGLRFGVSQTTVWRIKRGHSWRHVQ